MFRVTPKSDLSCFQYNNISIDCFRVYFSKGIAAFQVDCGIEERQRRVCLVEIREEERLIRNDNLIDYLNWGLLILFLVSRVTVLPNRTPIIAMRIIVKVVGFRRSKQHKGSE
jgi:hypothetical protein